LAAASALARRGFAVQLLESRPRLGGRASSFVDRTTGEIIDNCQHVSMRCCTSFAQFAFELEFDDCFEVADELTFIGPSNSSNKRVKFSSVRLPAPAHLAVSLLRQSWLTMGEKFRIAMAMRKLSRCRIEHDEPLLDWLIRHKQSENARRCFWHVVLVSALSETLDRISLKHARKVFVDGFLTNRHGWEVLIPTVPLDEIYESRIRTGLEKLGVAIRLKAGVDTINVDNDRASSITLRSGEQLEADFIISAVPQNVLPILIPHWRDHPKIQAVSQLETAPIASVHLWFDRELTSLKHAVFVDRLSHWVFNRSHESHTHKNGRWYYQVVISAARELEGLTEQEVLDRVENELKDVFCENQHVSPIHGRLITEHKAVFAPIAGVDERRLGQETEVTNLFLAGDWTQTGWPATMEGAVRSGYLAAECLLDSIGQHENLIADELPKSWLYRVLY
jgi:squalene-associated FAD-dependent desaturase